MGGFGSGRTGGMPTVEATDSLTLDVNRVMHLVKRALRAEGLRSVPAGRWLETQPIVFCWTRRDEAEPWAVVEVSLRIGAEWGEARLRYDVDHFSYPTGPRDLAVELYTTPCRFGGRRWWWLCPATGRRVAKLYLPNGGTRFLSRGPGAYRLAYQSQRDDWIGNAHARATRIHRRLGGPYGHVSSAPPPRPKRMRRATYDRLVGELWDIQMAIEDSMDARLVRAAGAIMRRHRR
jgi:hypothetical protein